MNNSLFETSAQTSALRQAVASIPPQEPETDDGGSLLGVAAIVSVSTRERLRNLGLQQMWTGNTFLPTV
jgi:hypothetical protein